MYFVLFQNSESAHVRNAFQPPTLPFAVSFGCLVQPNYIVHVKICALKPVPSPWNISQYVTNQQINTKILFCCFVLHMNLKFKYIYNVRMMFWWFVFFFPYFLYQKDVCEQSTRCWALWN